jgi:hypothetical protein
MYKIKNFKTTKEFVDFNEEFIYSNPMQNILLIRVIDEVAKGNLQVFQAFNLIGNKDIQMLVFVVSDYCLIYCNKYDESCIKILANELPFERLSDFVFAGEKETIENLLNLKGIPFIIEKHLTIHKCEKLNSEFKISPGKMRLATSTEIPYLTNLSVDFTEEYDGNKESITTMNWAVSSEISAKSLYVWEDSEICAMAIEMNRKEFGFPEIGKLYTILKYRKKGYSSSLVYKLTEKILSSNAFCMLYTHGENIGANRSFLKVGYVKTWDYVRIALKK